jgi:hypothetical protein
LTKVRERRKSEKYAGIQYPTTTPSGTGNITLENKTSPADKLDGNPFREMPFRETSLRNRQSGEMPSRQNVPQREEAQHRASDTKLTKAHFNQNVLRDDQVLGASVNVAKAGTQLCEEGDDTDSICMSRDDVGFHTRDIIALNISDEKIVGIRSDRYLIMPTTSYILQ